MLLHGSAFVVTSEAASASQIEDAIAADGVPQVILISLEIGGERAESTVETITRLKSLAPEMCVVALSDSLSIDQLTAALEAGADGYLLKDIAPQALKQSLLLALSGEKVLPTELVRLLVNGGVHRSTARENNAALAVLSERERQIVACLMNGMSNKAIAYQLSITEGTVKVHLKGVLKKIDARNRTQAAIWGMNNGFSDYPKG